MTAKTSQKASSSANKREAKWRAAVAARAALRWLAPVTLAALATACAPAIEAYPPVNMTGATGQPSGSLPPGAFVWHPGEPMPVRAILARGRSETASAGPGAQGAFPGIEHDALVGTTGYFAGRQFAPKPETPPGGVVEESFTKVVGTATLTSIAPGGTGEDAGGASAVPPAADTAGDTTAATGDAAGAATDTTAAETVTGRALSTGLAADTVTTTAEVGTGEAAGDVVAVGAGEVLLPAIVMIGGTYLAYRWWQAHHQPCSTPAAACGQ